MNEFNETSTSGSEPSPSDIGPSDDIEGDPNLSVDEPTVSYEIPFRTFAGVRDPSSKAIGAGVSLAAITAAFRYDHAMKEAIAYGAVLTGALISAYGPRLQVFLLGWNEERMAKSQMDKLQKMADAHPEDLELQKRASAARNILADGWLARIKRSFKPTGNAQRATKPRKPGSPSGKGKV